MPTVVREGGAERRMAGWDKWAKADGVEEEREESMASNCARVRWLE